MGSGGPLSGVKCRYAVRKKAQQAQTRMTFTQGPFGVTPMQMPSATLPPNIMVVGMANGQRRYGAQCRCVAQTKL